MKKLRKCVTVAGLLATGFGVGFLSAGGNSVQAQAKNRVFELRIATVTTKEKRDILLNRFRGGELKIWERFGMKPVGFWTPTSESPKSENTVIYILAHESRQQADKSWDQFRDDPEWKAFPKTPDIGPVQVERTYMDPVDFSLIK